MKKIISIGLVMLLALTLLYFFSKSDYHGKINQIEENNFLLFPLEIDTEADYSTPRIYFDDNTEVMGIVNSIEDLSDGQEVKVWETESEGVKYANKIKVIKE